MTGNFGLNFYRRFFDFINFFPPQLTNLTAIHTNKHNDSHRFLLLSYIWFIISFFPKYFLFVPLQYFKLMQISREGKVRKEIY